MGNICRQIEGNTNDGLQTGHSGEERMNDDKYFTIFMEPHVDRWVSDYDKEGSLEKVELEEDTCNLELDTDTRNDKYTTDFAKPVKNTETDSTMHKSLHQMTQNKDFHVTDSRINKYPTDSAKQDTSVIKSLHKEITNEDLDQQIKSYEKVKKGFLLIINYMFSGETNERKGSDEDVKKLTEFFQNMSYDVKSSETDLSKIDLVQFLINTRDTILEKQSYHCFMCVVMSHGNESGIKTTDDFIGMDDIVHNFKNDVFKSFIGKPKIFIFQACRGARYQEKQEKDGSHESIHCDFAASTIRLPTDADILKIYATIHGHVSLRRVNPKTWCGSWLIKSFLDAVKMFPERHIEEIMTAVRYDLSTNPEFEYNGGKCQIAVTENTLTKLFYL